MVISEGLWRYYIRLQYIIRCLLCCPSHGCFMRIGYKVPRQGFFWGDKNNADNISQSSTTLPQPTASKITSKFNKHLSDSRHKTFAEVVWIIVLDNI